MHTMWKGSISFGLVNIPVRMFAATEDKDVKFRQIHKECMSPIKYEKKCPNCNKELKQEDIVRGYEYEPGKFVVITDGELEALRESTGKAIEIMDFVSLSEIDPVYFIKTYYLSPQETGEKAYNLLREAMNQTGKIAIARITIREKQSLAAIRVYKNLLVMETIFYPDEVRDISQVPRIPQAIAVDEKELTMAKQIIENLTTEFEPYKYTDEYRKGLLELIQSKIEGDEVVLQPEVQQHNVVDLMKALQESLKVTEKLRQSDSSPVPKKKPAAKRKKETTAG
ncbi:MAG TPA: Ku protein [Candidatus Atribacteria bacterium]|nr:Ku protein [Candidatus Atribacteria bacterium]